MYDAHQVSAIPEGCRLTSIIYTEYRRVEVETFRVLAPKLGDHHVITRAVRDRRKWLGEILLILNHLVVQ